MRRIKFLLVIIVILFLGFYYFAKNPGFSKIFIQEIRSTDANSKLAYISNGLFCSSLVVIDIKKDKVSKYRIARDSHSPLFSPDSKKISFSSPRKQADTRIRSDQQHVLDLSRGTIKPTKIIGGQAVRWSLDGKYIFYANDFSFRNEGFDNRKGVWRYELSSKKNSFLSYISGSNFIKANTNQYGHNILPARLGNLKVKIGKKIYSYGKKSQENLAANAHWALNGKAIVTFDRTEDQEPVLLLLSVPSFTTLGKLKIGKAHANAGLCCINPDGTIASAFVGHDELFINIRDMKIIQREAKESNAFVLSGDRWLTNSLVAFDMNSQFFDDDKKRIFNLKNKKWLEIYLPSTKNGEPLYDIWSRDMQMKNALILD